MSVGSGLRKELGFGFRARDFLVMGSDTANIQPLHSSSHVALRIATYGVPWKNYRKRTCRSYWS